MTSEFFFFYTEANLVCCALFAVILMHDLRRFNHRETQVRFDDALAAHILYFISDSCWAALVSAAVHFHHFFALLVNFSNFFLMGLLGCTWFRFMAASEQLPFRNTKKGKVLISLPMAVMSGVLALSYFAAPKLWVSDSGSLTPLYYTLIPVAPILYTAAGSVICALSPVSPSDSLWASATTSWDRPRTASMPAWTGQMRSCTWTSGCKSSSERRCRAQLADGHHRPFPFLLFGACIFPGFVA